MRLLDRLTDRYRQQGYFEGMASGAAVLMTFGSDSKREIVSTPLVAAAQQAYTTNGVVFAVILARMMLLSEAVFKMRSKVDKHLYGTEDLRILEYPWPNGTTGELWARMEQDVSLAGNFFAWKAEDDLIVRLPPEQVTIVSQEDTSPGGGTYKTVIGYDWDPNLNFQQLAGAKDRKAHFFTADEIAHWSPYPDPAANFRGMSWLTPIVREVTADSGMTDYKTQYLNHGQPVAAMKYPGKLRADTVDAIIERVMAKYGGVANAWKPFVLSDGADPVMGAALKDLDFRAVQAGGELRICAAGGVSPILIGLRNAESGESYQTAMRQLADMHIRPLWRSGCAALQKFVPNVPDKGVQLWYDTSDIAALQAAETERAQVTQVSAAAMLTMIQAGMTRESVIAAVTSGDLSQLVPDPLAPTPGVVERETITGTTPFGSQGQPDPGSTGAVPAAGRPPRVGTPPGGPQTLTKPQTPASKTPMPSSFPTPATKGAPNGKGP